MLNSVLMIMMMMMIIIIIIIMIMIMHVWSPKSSRRFFVQNSRNVFNRCVKAESNLVTFAVRRWLVNLQCKDTAVTGYSRPGIENANTTVVYCSRGR